MRSLPLRILCAALVAGATALVAPNPAAAADANHLPRDVPGGFASWAELHDMQERLNAAATAIQAAAAEVAAKSGENGYSSVLAAPENRRLDLYWKGAIPEAVQQVIAAQGKQVPIRVIPARFSETELIAEVRRLGGQPGVGEAAPMVDGSGVRVRLRRGAVAANAFQSSGVPTTVAGEAGEGAYWSCASGAGFCREDDTPSYYSGARTTGCTAGFAINWNGNSRMFTAGHCGSNGTQFFDGGGQYMGNMINDNNLRDTAMIDTRSAGRMWDGGRNSTFSKAVQGTSLSLPGNYVCTSGSWSGVICGIQIRIINVDRNGHFPMVEAERTNHGQAGGPGDSGGPVFSLPSPDNGKVIAKGIIQGPDTTTTVPCTIGDTNRTGCAWRFYYADVSQALAFYGASIRTA